MTLEMHDFFEFIKASPSPYHSAQAAVSMLEREGYVELAESEPFALERGGKYYCRRGDSAIIAFRIPTGRIGGFNITASHGDSPALRLRSSDVYESGGYIHVPVERYGSMLRSSWIDRPLELSGRAIVRDGDAYSRRLFRSNKGICIIPSLAPHLNAKANKDQTIDPAKDLIPVIGCGGTSVSITEIIAECLSLQPCDIVSYDGVLSISADPELVGVCDDMIASPRLDDLMCAYTMLRGFISSADSPADDRVPVYVLCDGEEIGSSIREGAASDFMPSVLARIARSCDGGDLCRFVDTSMVISADNAHAVHPNHPEYAEMTAAPLLGGGVTLKHSASRSYTTDAVGSAIVSEICKTAGVPIQHYENRGDLPGGSTLGAIAQSGFSCVFADIGASQLAMHSAIETAGAADVTYLSKFAEEYYRTGISVCGNTLKIGD